jgi:metal-responsive CopG/Arc/MetJ family transcriptional regulator
MDRKEMSMVSVKLENHLIDSLKELIPDIEKNIGVPVTFSDVIRWACRDYVKNSRDYVKNKGGKK